MKHLLRPKDLPMVLDIGSSPYHLIHVHRMAEEDLGACDDAEKLIFVSRDQDLIEFNRTLWHEIFHAWQKELGLPITHRQIEKMEVDIVNLLGQLYGEIKSRAR
jgi:hypothetical protein